VALNYIRRGSGDPTVLIHGLGSQWQVWGPVIDRLAAERDVVALDLPGFGDSDPLPAGVGPSEATMADAVEGLLDELGWDRPHVVGNSLGGWTALELAKRGRARSVAAISPAGFGLRREARFSVDSLRLTHRFARLMSPVAPVVLASPLRRKLLLSQVFNRPERMTVEAAVGAVRNFARSPGVDSALDWIWTDQFRGGEQIDVPVTMIWGEREMLLPRRKRQAARSIRAVPGARLVWLPGAGHTPTWDDPPAVADAILAAGRDTAAVAV
jgi:pimeloyl-ACP methyl ester carboxylesterase